MKCFLKCYYTATNSKTVLAKKWNSIENSSLFMVVKWMYRGLKYKIGSGLNGIQRFVFQFLSSQFQSDYRMAFTFV